MENRSIQWQTYGRVMLLAHADVAPDEAEWMRYAEDLVARAKQGTIDTLLVFTDGAGPSPRQRKSVIDVPKHFRTVVITRSAISRGIVTALAWVGVNIRAFAPSELDAGFARLEIPTADREPMMRLLASMRLSLMGLRQSDDAELSMLRVRTVLEGKFGDTSLLKKSA